MIMVWYDLEMVSFHEVTNLLLLVFTFTSENISSWVWGWGEEDSHVKVGDACHLF